MGNNNQAIKAPEDNAFIGALIQVLWNLSSFRERLLTMEPLEENHDQQRRDVVQPLYELFRELRRSKQSDITSEVLTVFLEQFCHKDLEYEDFEKAFLAILDQFHRLRQNKRIPHANAHDLCDPLCLAHESFGMQLCLLRSCTRCNSTSEPKTVNRFILKLKASDISDVIDMKEDFYSIFRMHEKKMFKCPHQENREKMMGENSLVYVKDMWLVDFEKANVKELKTGDKFSVTERAITLQKPRATDDFLKFRKSLDDQFYEVYRFVENGGTLVVPAIDDFGPHGILQDPKLPIKHGLFYTLPLNFRKQLQAQLNHLNTACKGSAFEATFCFSCPPILSIHIEWPNYPMKPKKELVEKVHMQLR